MGTLAIQIDRTFEITENERPGGCRTSTKDYLLEDNKVTKRRSVFL